MGLFLRSEVPSSCVCARRSSRLSSLFDLFGSKHESDMMREPGFTLQGIKHTELRILGSFEAIYGTAYRGR